MKLAISNIISSTVRSEHELGGAKLTLKVSPRARRLRLHVDPRTRLGDPDHAETNVAAPRPRLGGRPSRLGRSSARRDPRSLARSRRARSFRSTACPTGSTGTRPGRAGSSAARGGWSRAGPRRPRSTAAALAEGAVRSTCSIPKTREYCVKAGVKASAESRSAIPVSRWGSCSASGAIRYSWRLMLAPDWVRQATVAHEVAHRVHMNHGPDFHALVAKICSKRIRSRRAPGSSAEGAALHRIGHTPSLDAVWVNP